MNRRAATHSRSAGTTSAPARAVVRGEASRGYRRFLPYQFLKLLGKARIADIRLGDNVEKNMTILFSDIRDFTSLSEAMTPRENFRFINAYLKEMEPVLFQSNGFIDKYIGDAIMAVFPGSADDALGASLGMLRRLRRFNAARRRSGAPEIRIGIGLNTGLAMAGAVGGQHRMETTVISDAVNLASRIESLTKTYGVPLLISEHVLYSLEEPAAHDIRFVDRVRVKGKEQPQSVYEVFDADAPGLRSAKRRTKPVFEEALAHYHFRDIAKARTLLHRCLASCPGDLTARVYAERCARFVKSGVHEGTGEIGMSITWGDQYRINHALIDDQHRTLFAQVNKFVRAMRGVRTSAQAEQLSAFLQKYVIEHFETEERCMRERRYPLLELQQQQHARFTRDFGFLDAEIREKLATQRTFMLFKIQLLVVDWIAHHTMKLDKHFGRYAGRS
jgi:hemerythrin-like metal-binding protein